MWTSHYQNWEKSPVVVSKPLSAGFVASSPNGPKPNKPSSNGFKEKVTLLLWRRNTSDTMQQDWSERRDIFERLYLSTYPGKYPFLVIP